MTPGAVLELLEAAGVSLSVGPGFLQYRAPAGAYTDEMRALVAEHREALIHEWRCWLCGAICRVLYGMGPMPRCSRCARLANLVTHPAYLRLREEQERHGRDAETEGGARV